MLCRAVLCCVLPDYVPPLGKGSLYLRPLLLGSGPILGLGPAPSYTFTIYAAAVGSYFKVSIADCAAANVLLRGQRVMPIAVRPNTSC